MARHVLINGHCLALSDVCLRLLECSLSFVLKSMTNRIIALQVSSALDYVSGGVFCDGWCVRDRQ